MAWPWPRALPLRQNEQAYFRLCCLPYVRPRCWLNPRLTRLRSSDHPSGSHRPARPRGFTLIELLVALGIMALLALMSWRGLDALLRAARTMREHGAALLGLQAGLTQWRIDLDQRVESPYLPVLDWDGRVLRLLRSSPAGTDEAWQVVAWTQRLAAGSLQWTRWQSAPLSRRAELLNAWQEASAWGRATGDLKPANNNHGTGATDVNGKAPGGANANPEASAVAVTPLIGWQLLHYRGGQWLRAETLTVPARETDAAGRPRTAVPQAGAGTAGGLAAGSPALEGLRLLLDLPLTGSLQGQLGIDWFNPLNPPTSPNALNAVNPLNPLNPSGSPGAPR
jgi:general secretion pathway protein J